VETVVPLLNASPGPVRIIVPPQPRYLFNGCCGNEEHCTNLKQPNYAEKLLTSTIHLRDILKKKVVGRVGQPFWIADSCLASKTDTDCTVPGRLVGMTNVYAKDGVHYNTGGYGTIADNLIKLVTDVATGKIGKKHGQNPFTPASSVSGSGGNHFWRGITSPVGSSKPSYGSYPSKHQREKSHRSMTPYSRGGGGGRGVSEGSGKLYQWLIVFFSQFSLRGFVKQPC